MSLPVYSGNCNFTEEDDPLKLTIYTYVHCSILLFEMASRMRFFFQAARIHFNLGRNSNSKNNNNNHGSREHSCVHMLELLYAINLCSLYAIIMNVTYSY